MMFFGFIFFGFPWYPPKKKAAPFRRKVQGFRRFLRGPERVLAQFQIFLSASATEVVHFGVWSLSEDWFKGRPKRRSAL